MQILKDLCRSDNEALGMIDKLTQGKGGGQKGNNNATKHKTTVDNINSRFEERPAGTSSQYGLRQLRQAIDKATGDEETKLKELQHRVIRLSFRKNIQQQAFTIKHAIEGFIVNNPSA